ncbi:hypothetical protein ACH9DO_02510 [Kocuria sp. M1N1S27]|uniref:hypothetical protein n=1 Tax=Kocuria kalidii TaxID=3376283 RepID=UPI0037ABBCF8
MSGDPVPQHAPGTGSAVLHPTGHAQVDAVLERAAELELLPVAEHPAHYEVLHAALVAALDAEPGTEPAGPAPDTPALRGEAGPR